MHKNIKIVLAFILAIALTKPLNVHAEHTEKEVIVKTYDDLKKSAADKTVDRIILGDDITVASPILFLHNVTVDGNGKTLTAVKTKDAASWESLYILKFHGVDATVTNIKLSGGDAAIQVNNSTLDLRGTITLGNQAFGGIELTQGKNKTKDVALSTLEATFTNETEVKGIPTIWTDQLETLTFGDARFIKRDDIKNNQNHYYLKDPNTATVKDEAGLREALDEKATTIVLANDIDVAGKINVLYDVTIDGNGFALKGKDTEGWNGFYLLHFFKVTATVKDITLTGADAGLYANGSTVTLLGGINVSGNEFGGIEVSQGEGVEAVPVLDAKGAVLVNDTEDFGLPTVWNDGTKGEVLMDNLVIRTDVKANQTQYYLNQVTPKEKKVTDFVLEVFEHIDIENFEVIVDKETRKLTFLKLTEGAVLTEDKVVAALVSAILGHDNVEKFTVNDRTYDSHDEATVKAAVREFIELVKENNEDSINVFNGLKVMLNFDVTYDGVVVPTEDIDVTFIEKVKEDPVDPGDKEEPKIPGDEEEVTEKPKDKTDQKVEEKDKKIPATGLGDLTTMYASLLVMSALVFVLMKLKKRTY